MKSLNYKKFVFIFFLLCSFVAYSQQQSFTNRVRIKLASPLDAYPGIEVQKGSLYDNAVERLKETAPFIMDGMIYGWTFDYVPYDKARGVEEFFEVNIIKSLSDDGYKINYSEPQLEDNNALSVWVSFDRTPGMIAYYKNWEALVHPKIHGTGKGNLSDGFEGIKAAYEDAIKNAVNQYERKKLKNKPKEICGSIIICAEPRMYISAGQYTVELDFFVEVDRIEVYTRF